MMSGGKKPVPMKKTASSTAIEIIVPTANVPNWSWL